MCVSCIKPACPLGVVNDSDELIQELMEYGHRVVGSSDGHDDGVHVDTEAQEIYNGHHCVNANNGDFCLGLVHFDYIHALLGVGYHVLDTLLFDHACVPLREKG